MVWVGLIYQYRHITMAVCNKPPQDERREGATVAWDVAFFVWSAQWFRWNVIFTCFFLVATNPSFPFRALLLISCISHNIRAGQRGHLECFGWERLQHLHRPWPALDLLHFFLWYFSMQSCKLAHTPKYARMRRQPQQCCVYVRVYSRVCSSSNSISQLALTCVYFATLDRVRVRWLRQLRFLRPRKRRHFVSPSSPRDLARSLHFAPRRHQLAPLHVRNRASVAFTCHHCRHRHHCSSLCYSVHMSMQILSTLFSLPRPQLSLAFLFANLFVFLWQIIPPVLSSYSTLFSSSSSLSLTRYTLVVMCGIVRTTGRMPIWR